MILPLLPLVRLRRLAGWLGFLITAHPAWAEPTQRTLSLEQALETITHINPDIIRAQRSLQQQRALKERYTPLLRNNPEIGGTLGRRFDDSGSQPPANGVEYGIQLGQTIEIANQRGARLEEADAAIALAEQQLQATILQAKATVKFAYVQALLAQSAADNAQQQATLADQILQATRTRVEQGAAAEVDLGLAEIEEGRAIQELAEYQIRTQQSLVQLANLLDLPNHQQLYLSTSLPRPSLPKESLETLIEQALLQRADVLIIEKSQLETQKSVQRLQREVIPSPTLRGEFLHQQPGQWYWGGTLMLPFPLWQRNQGEILHQQQEVQRKMDDLFFLRRTTEREMRQLIASGQVQEHILQRWEQQVIPGAQANLEMVQEGYRAGKFDLFRLVQISRESRSAFYKQLEILANLWHICITIDRYRGIT